MLNWLIDKIKERVLEEIKLEAGKMMVEVIDSIFEEEFDREEFRKRNGFNFPFFPGIEKDYRGKLEVLIKNKTSDWRQDVRDYIKNQGIGALSRVYDQFDREEFIDKIIARINRKQLNVL